MCIRDRIITNRGKGLIEDHFDHAPELEQRLEATGKRDMLREIQSISHLANICFIRQKETRGLGHAVGCARSFVGNEPFAVLYGDDVILEMCIRDSPCTASGKLNSAGIIPAGHQTLSLRWNAFFFGLTTDPVVQRFIV